MDVGKTLARKTADFAPYLARLAGRRQWAGRWRAAGAVALLIVATLSLWLVLSSPLVTSAEREGGPAAAPPDA